MFEDDLQKAIKKLDREAKPSFWFKAKMDLWCMKKSTVAYFSRKGSILRFSMASVLFLVMAIGSFGTYVYSSPEVNAASMFYPLKQGLESVEMHFASNPEDQALLHLKRAIRRGAESQAIENQMKNSSNEDLRKAFETTVNNLESEMNESFSIDGDIAPAPAQNLLNNMHRSYSTLNDQVVKMQSMHSKMPNLKDKLNQQMQRIQKAREKVKEAILNKQPKVSLKDILKSSVLIQQVERGQILEN